MKFYKIILISTILLLLFIELNAQKEILSENVDAYKVFTEKKFGPNSKFFVYNYISLSYFLPAIKDQQIDIKYGKSYNFTYGLRFKYKIAKILSIGSSINYSWSNLLLKTSFLPYLVPNNGQEKLVVHTLGSEIFTRITFCRTGNSFGKYLEIGIFGHYIAGNTLIMKQINSKPINLQARKYVSKHKGIDLYRGFQYGPELKIGIKNIALIFRYRYSTMFNDNILQFKNDIPKLSVGLEIYLF